MKIMKITVICHLLGFKELECSNRIKVYLPHPQYSWPQLSFIQMNQ